MRLTSLLFASILGVAQGQFTYSFTTGTVSSLPFTWTYSYDQHPSTGVNPNYFSIVPAPVATPVGANALRINIFESDLPEAANENTCPRSEMSGYNFASISDSTPYVVQWYSYLSQYVEGYDFAFAQVFGNQRANIILKFERGQYFIASVYNTVIDIPLSGSYNQPVVSADLHEDMNRWVSWRIEFNLAPVQGTVTVYKDGILLGTMAGNLAAGGASYWKQGIYTQYHGTDANTGDLLCTTNNTQIYIQDLSLTQGLPSAVPHLATLSASVTNPSTTTTTTTTTVSTTIPPSTKAPNTGTLKTTIPTSSTTVSTHPKSTFVTEQVKIPTYKPPTSPASKPVSTMIVFGYALSVAIILFSFFGPNVAQ